MVNLEDRFVGYGRVERHSGASVGFTMVGGADKYRSADLTVPLVVVAGAFGWWGLLCIVLFRVVEGLYVFLVAACSLRSAWISGRERLGWRNIYDWLVVEELQYLVRPHLWVGVRDGHESKRVLETLFLVVVRKPVLCPVQHGNPH